jgi:hypothetical protein
MSPANREFDEEGEQESERARERRWEGGGRESVRVLRVCWDRVGSRKRSGAPRDTSYKKADKQTEGGREAEGMGIGLLLRTQRRANGRRVACAGKLNLRTHHHTPAFSKRGGDKEGAQGDGGSVGRTEMDDMICAGSRYGKSACSSRLRLRTMA